ncbi:MAG TPA: sugar phosphate nucleotidyltransferase [Bacteroidota bacterium]|nr:sugar phosphate nucleotidyltransferase [Bacteroidota bacterium]
MDPNIVILAAGISSRMKRAVPAQESLDPMLAREAQLKPKSMIGLGEGRRPFLDYLLFNVSASGYRDVVLVIGEKDREIRDYYGEPGGPDSFEGLRISYVVQTIPEGRSKPLGTADALSRTLTARPDWKGKRFTVCNSDNLYSVKALSLLLEMPDECGVIDYDRDALEFEPSRFAQFSVLSKDSEGYLTRIIEKPSPEQAAAVKNGCGRIGVSMNIFRFLYDRILPVLDEVPLHPVRDERELPGAVMMLVERYPKSVKAIPLSEHVPDLTYQQDIVRVQEYLRMNFQKMP